MEETLLKFMALTGAQPVTVNRVDDEEATPQQCYFNAKRYAENNNGKQVSGWVAQRKSADSLYFLPHYWVQLQSGEYVDVIPQDILDISLYLLDDRIMSHPKNGLVMLSPLLVDGDSWSFVTDITNNTLVPCVSLDLDYLFDTSKVIYK
jgi:hypothetical protein